MTAFTLASLVAEWIVLVGRIIRCGLLARVATKSIALLAFMARKLRTIIMEQVKAEPVAWMYEKAGEVAFSRVRQHRLYGSTEIPLYANPQPAAVDGLVTPPPASADAMGEVERLQSRVQPWLLTCFGAEIAGDTLERTDRFVEEALELAQTNPAFTAERAHVLVDYVFGRPVGEPTQEVGGVMITLAALCLASGLDMHEAGETELARIWTKVDAIRAKQAAKPTGSALPIATAALSAMSPAGEVERAVLAERERCACLAEDQFFASAIAQAIREPKP